jgi:hypothetical protein
MPGENVYPSNGQVASSIDYCNQNRLLRVQVPFSTSTRVRLALVLSPISMDTSEFRAAEGCVLVFDQCFVRISTCTFSFADRQDLVAFPAVDMGGAMEVDDAGEEEEEPG